MRTLYHDDWSNVSQHTHGRKRSWKALSSVRGRFDWRAASTCCDCWATSNGGNAGGGGFFLFSSFVTTSHSVAVDDAAGGVGSGVSCAATWRLFSPSASVRGAAELPEAAPSSCTMLKSLNCWISQEAGFTQLEQQMATRPHVVRHKIFSKISRT